MNTQKLMTVDDFNKLYDSIKPEFYDFGCSKGDSILFGQKIFANENKVGLGIDISQKKVNATREAGLQAIAFDILDIPLEKKVKFTIMSHFLEHIPEYNDVKKFIRKACELSSDFIFIKQPFFDADGYLLQMGLKCYWSHWKGHPNTMSTLDLYRTLKDLKNEGVLGNFSIHLKQLIRDSYDPNIIPLDAAIDQHQYDPEIHPEKKKKIKFKFPVYRETIAFISIPGDGHRELLKKFKVDKTIIDENENLLMA